MRYRTASAAAFRPPKAAATQSAQLPQLRREAGDNARDTRPMIAIGLLLGTAYLVFLTVWIWATRVRPRLTRGRSH